VFGLENLDGWKILVLVLLGIFIFGPEKLPKAISDGVRMLRNLRDMARNATSDLSRELGTDIQLEDLNPKALIRKHLLSEEDERTLRKPLEDIYRQVETDVRGIQSDLKDTASAIDAKDAPSTPGDASPTPAAEAVATPPAASRAVRQRYDTDAT
jgi:sec-independent protein translocase protein TatB